MAADELALSIPNLMRNQCARLAKAGTGAGSIDTTEDLQRTPPVVGRIGLPLQGTAVKVNLLDQPDLEIILIQPGKGPHVFATPPVAGVEQFVFLQSSGGGLDAGRVERQQSRRIKPLKPNSA